MDAPTERQILNLLHLRTQLVEQAREALAERLAEEARATDALLAIEAAISRETEAASDAAGGDDVVEAFAAWLRLIRSDQADAKRALSAAETRTCEARAVLSSGRSSLEALRLLRTECSAEAPAAAPSATLGTHHRPSAPPDDGPDRAIGDCHDSPCGSATSR
ncbi:MAG: hypothetical protein AB7F35_22045 [Acetobacteraceae bacterium]